MIIEYTDVYQEDLKNLLDELQEHIVSIDKDKYNIKKENFKEEYFKKTLEDVKKYEGKIFLASIDNKIVGAIVTLINNEEIDTYDFKAPKRGRISELVVSKKYRHQGIGKLLIEKSEEYLQSVGCKDVLINVFAFNTNAYELYKKLGYHDRTVEMLKKIN